MSSRNSMKYIDLRIPVGEMTKDEREKVRGIIKSFFTAVYHDLTDVSYKNTAFYLVERLRDKESRRLILYSLTQFVKNHEKISLENDDFNSLSPLSSTFHLMEITKRRIS